VRAFVAIEIDPTHTAGGPGRAPDHLTLEFLGEIDPAGVGALGAALGPVGDALGPFELVLEGVGAFPNRERPRVIWVGARDGRAEVSELARRVAEALRPLGHPSPREAFEPHLTLFRVRSDRDRRRARELLDGVITAPPPRTVRVDRIHLKESVLAPEGAVHRTLVEVTLRGAARGTRP